MKYLIKAIGRIDYIVETDNEEEAVEEFNAGRAVIADVYDEEIQDIRELES